MTNEQNMVEEYKRLFDVELSPFEGGYPCFWYMKIFDIWEYVREMSRDEIKLVLGCEIGKTISTAISMLTTIYTMHYYDTRNVHRNSIELSALIKFCDKFDLEHPTQVGAIQKNTDVWFEIKGKKFVFPPDGSENRLFLFFLGCVIRKYHKKIMV